MSVQHSVRGAASGWKEPGGGREGKEGEPGLGGLRAAAPSEATVTRGPLESVSGTSGDGGPGVRQPSGPGAGAVRGQGVSEGMCGDGLVPRQPPEVYEAVRRGRLPAGRPRFSCRRRAEGVRACLPVCRKHAHFLCA